MMKVSDCTIKKKVWVYLLNQVRASYKPAHAWFFIITSVRECLYVCLCVCVCVSTTEAININKLYSYNIVAIHSMVSGHGLSNDAHHRNQPNKSQLTLYKLLSCFNSRLRHMHISNKTQHFSCKGGCCWGEHTVIEVFKRRAGLVLQINSFRILLFKTAVIPIMN